MSRGIQFPFVVVAALLLCGSTLLLIAKPLEVEPPRPSGTPIEADYGVDFDKAVALFEQRVATRDKDFLSRAKLGSLYIQKAKASEDGTYFDRAEQQYASALALHPGHAESKLGLASVALANHHFDQGLQLAEEVRTDDPTQLLALAMMGDAQIELGEYAEAADSYGLLALKLDTAPVQARVSRLDEIQGRPDQAIDIMREAWQQVRDVNATGASEAWYLQRLGELQLSQSRHQEARESFLEARRLDPTSSHAITFLGHAAARSGQYQEAEKHYWQALELTNDAGLYAALGDLRMVQGKADEADAYYDRAVMLWDHSSHGHHHHGPSRLPGEPTNRKSGHATHSHSHANPDAHARTLSVFLSDRDREPTKALNLAQTNLQSRHDVYSYDALAWAAYRSGQLAAAQEASEAALAQGTRDASLWYHAGVIQAALGDRETAIASLEIVMAIDPAFSVLHAGSARTLLEKLRRGE